MPKSEAAEVAELKKMFRSSPSINRRPAVSARAVQLSGQIFVCYGGVCVCVDQSDLNCMQVTPEVDEGAAGARERARMRAL